MGPEEIAEEVLEALEGEDVAEGENGEIYILGSDGNCEAIVEACQEA